jgi:ABC-type branched-subunit amino acid transport system substrate-binding protein
MARRSAIAVLVAVALGAACGPRFDDDGSGGLGSPTTGPASGTTVATPSTIAGPGPAPGVTDTEIKIGYLLPLTGAAPIPSRFDKGVNAYWDYVNAQGGIDGRQVKVVIEDTESQAEVGKDKAKKLIETDEVFAIIVLDRLENQEALGRYLNDRQVPNLAVQAPANLPADQIWTFGVTIDHAVQGALAAQYFVRELDATKVAVVYENTPVLDPGREAFEAEAEELGADVVYSKAIDGQGNDFSSEALALSQSGADVVWLYMAPTPAAKLANQADAAGFHPVWFANSISWAFTLVFAVGPESLAGARAFSPWLPLSDDRAATFLEAFRAGGAAAPDDDLGIVGWGIGQILAEAIRQAGPDLGQNSLRDALQHLQFEPDIWAPIAFDDGVRQGANQVAVLREEDGQWVLDRDFTGEFPD